MFHYLFFLIPLTILELECQELAHTKFCNIRKKNYIINIYLQIWNIWFIDCMFLQSYKYDNKLTVEPGI